MTLKEIVDVLKIEVVTGTECLAAEVTGGYAGDLLSDVISRAEAGNVWITMQVHQNIVAVAVLKNLAGIILVNGREPLPDTMEKARKENIAILRCPLGAFDVAGKLYALGISGSRGSSESVTLPN